MLEKFQIINKVGLFESYTHSPECDFGEITLIYGENGVGKSTLAAILDSLREENPNEIIRRRSLPGAVASAVVVRVNEKDYVFDGYNWNAPLTRDTLEIFYPSFVTRNVYSSTGVDATHRRNLCEFVIGRTAVENVARLEGADREGRITLTEINAVDHQLHQLIQYPDTIDTFSALPNDPKIDEKIEQIRAELKQAQGRDAIIARESPESVPLPVINRAIVSTVLEKHMDGVGADISTVIQDHVMKHLDKDGERWLSYGARFISDNKCPFCAQNVEGSSLVTAIHSYFSARYRDYHESLSCEIQALRDIFGDNAFMKIRMTIMIQITKATQWINQLAFDRTAMMDSLSDAEKIWKSAAEKLETVLKLKQSKMLDRIDPSLADEALVDYDRALALLSSINKILETIGRTADERKRALAKADTVKIEQDLKRLENQKRRFETFAKDLLEKRKQLNEIRNKLEEEKIKLKKEIEEHALKVVEKYQTGINHYLEYFVCDIRIEAVKHGFPSGRASVQYMLRAHGHKIELGLSADNPCFETVLSEGDKYTLALSFFLARLKDCKSLAGRIIVLDDPVNSFGNARRGIVKNIIRDLHKRGAQVVVLTHDERLAAMMWCDYQLKNKITPLQVERTRRGSQLRKWDAEAAVQCEYVKQFLTINDYVENGGDHTKAAACIRPYVEHRLRYLFPGPPFTAQNSLGQMIGMIRNSNSAMRIHALHEKLHRLDAINDAALPSYHATDDVPGMTPPTPDKVRIFAMEALSI